MKRRKGFRKKRPLIQSWLGTNFRPAFRGYPLATVAYGGNDKLATKVVVSVLLLMSCCVPFTLAAQPIPGISFVARRDFQIQAALMTTTDLNGDGKPDLITNGGGGNPSLVG